MRPINSPTENTYPVPTGTFSIGVSSTNSLLQLYATLGIHYTYTGGVVTMTLQSYIEGLAEVMKRYILGTDTNVLTSSQASQYHGQFLGAIGGGNLSVENIYQLARNDLITSLGQFCSFCELPVGDSGLHVEHVLPKSMFLDLSCTFSNFLLACPTCNSKKGTNPTSSLYYWPIKWSKPAITTTSATANWPKTLTGYYQIQTVIKNAYLWPEYYKAYKKFTHSSQYETSPNTWVTHNPAQTAQITSIQNSVIHASHNGVAPAVPVNVTVTGTGQKVKDNNVTVTPLPLTSASPSSTSMIDSFDSTSGQGLLGLDELADIESFSDRRLFNRTRTWFAAITAFNRLSSAQSLGLASYNLMMGEVCSTASAMGFFSVWVTVFNCFAPAQATPTGPIPAGTPPTNIPHATAQLIYGLTTGNAANNIPPPPPGGGFPGTNINNTIP